jgi:alpha-ribazole phosphatase
VSKKKKLFLLRHGKIGFSGKYVGVKDVPLTPEGISQIKNLQKVLQGKNFYKIYSSPMQRCRQTCDILFPNSVVTHRKNLKEINFGRWEGLTFEEISSRDPKIVTEWANNLPDFTFPEGESVDSFTKRVHTIGTEIAEGQGDNVLIVSHGGVIRSLLCHFLGIAPQNYLLFQVKKGNYSTIDMFGAEGVLTGFNLH